MGILKNFKKQSAANQKKDSYSSAPASSLKSPKKSAVVSKKSAKKTEKKTLKPLIVQGFEYTLIRKPVVTEKSSRAEQDLIYVFEVDLKADKRQIKVALEHLFPIHVIRVHTVRLPSKTRRRGRFSGQTSLRKKAYVQIREGEKIDLFTS